MRFRPSRALLGALASAALLGAPTALAATGHGARDGADSALDADRTGRLIVQVDPPAPDRAPGESLAPVRGQIAAVLARANAEAAAPAIEEIGAVAVTPEGETLAQLKRELLADPRVESVEAETTRELLLVPNDPALSSSDANAPGGDVFQWNLFRSNFPTAWDRSSGSGASVAIVDTGTDGSHPDLGQVAAAVDHDPSAPTGALNDENGHGTHVAGLACGNSNNGYGIASAGFDCPLIVEKLEVNGNALTDASIIAGIVDAANQGADVINMSFGGAAPSPALSDAIDYAYANDVVMVAAASNNNTSNQGYPAQYLQPTGTAPDINQGKGLVVTAAEYDDTRADLRTVNPGAGFGTGVSLAAYGDSSVSTSGIFSSYPADQTTREPAVCPTPPCAPRTSFFGDDRFAYLFGTSMAAPQVSGAAALIRSLDPGIANTTVIRALKEGARPGSFSSELGWGILDTAGALSSSGVATAAAGGDAGAPDSRLRIASRKGKRLKLEVSSADAAVAGGVASGIKEVSVFAARKGKKYRVIKKVGPGEERIRFRGKSGARYRFYSRALDNAGNLEPEPEKPDVKTRLRG